MAQDDGKQYTAEQQKRKDVIDSVNQKVNACNEEWSLFEDLCWSDLRNMGLYLYIGAVDPGTKKVASFEKLSLDQILSEIDGKNQTIYSYLRDHSATVNGEHKTEVRGYNTDGKNIVKWTSCPTVTFKKTAPTGTTAKPKPGSPSQAAGPPSLTKDILTALPSIVSAVQLLQPKPQTNNDSKLILDFMKYQQENMDRLQDQRKEDRKEMKDLVENITSSRSPVQELAELEEFRQTVTANTRPSTPPLIGGAQPTASAWDRLADLGGKYLESAMNQHNQRQGAAQQEQVVDAKRAEISELAAEEQVDVSIYLEDLANLIKSEVEPISVLKGVQETLTFAKEHNQLNRIKELSDNDNDLELALLSLCEAATENADYVNSVMKSAQPFIPLVAAELGLIKVEENGKPDMEHANPIGVAVSSEESISQETP